MRLLYFFLQTFIVLSFQGRLLFLLFIQFALQFYFLLPTFREKYRGQALTFYYCNFVLVHKCISLSIFRLLLSPAHEEKHAMEAD